MRHLLYFRLMRFFSDRTGKAAVAISLGLTFAVLIIGIAVDVTRFFDAKLTIQRALDNAIFSAASEVTDARGSGSLREAVVKRSQIYLRTHLQGDNTFDIDDVVNSLKIVRNAQNKKIEANVGVAVPTLFSGLFGFKKLGGQVVSTANMPFKTEIVFVLDNSALMNELIQEQIFEPKILDGIDVNAVNEFADVAASNAADRMTALRSLKEGLQASVETLLEDENKDFIRVGLVPYSHAVNLGSFHRKAVGKNTPSSFADNQCVTERESSVGFADRMPTKEDSRTYYETDQLLRFNGKSGCPKVAVRPLSNDRHALLNDIEALDGSGFSAGHIGLTWGYNLLSESFQDFWPETASPADYDETKVRKILVKISGSRSNTTYIDEIINGDANKAHHQARHSSTFMGEMCKRAAEEVRNIRVFTIIIGAENSSDVLRSCATNKDDHLMVEEHDELQNALKMITFRVLQPVLSL